MQGIKMTLQSSLHKFSRTNNHRLNFFSLISSQKFNVEDNEYSESVDPSLEFVVTSEDITSTLLIFNNEKGFSERNIGSICSVGRSTKKGHPKRGYIREKVL